MDGLWRQSGLYEGMFRKTSVVQNGFLQYQDEYYLFSTLEIRFFFFATNFVKVFIPFIGVRKKVLSVLSFIAALVVCIPGSSSLAWDKL